MGRQLHACSRMWGKSAHVHVQDSKYVQREKHRGSSRLTSRLSQSRFLLEETYYYTQLQMQQFRVGRDCKDRLGRRPQIEVTVTYGRLLQLVLSLSLSLWDFFETSLSMQPGLFLSWNSAITTQLCPAFLNCLKALYTQHHSDYYPYCNPTEVGRTHFKGSKQENVSWFHDLGSLCSALIWGTSLLSRHEQTSPPH